MRLLRTFVICSFLLEACSSLSTATPLPSTVISSVATPSFTSVPITPTLIPNATATKTAGPVSEIPPCTDMNVQEVISADYQIPGVMLSLDRPPDSSFSGRGEYQVSSLYHFDLPTRVETFLIKPEDYQEKIKGKITRIGVDDLSVSPDFQKAVYLVDAYIASDWIASKSWLEIYDSGTNERIRFPWKDEWEYIIGWINNDRFAIRSGGSVLLFDPEGHRKDQLLSSNLPDYVNPRTDNPNVFVLWGGYRNIGYYSIDKPDGVDFAKFFSDRALKVLYNPALEVYSPTFEDVIYAEAKDGKAGIVLYNVQEQKKVIEIITDDDITFKSFGGAPVWSPEGSRAVMLLPASANNSTEQRLFLLDIFGRVEQLTSFEILGPYSWSPDGKYVAFWLADGKEIGILNIENKGLRVFCIQGDYSNGASPSSSGFAASGDLVWLPNDTQLLVEIEKFSSDVRYEGIGVADLDKALFIELQWNVSHPLWLEK